MAGKFKVRTFEFVGGPMDGDRIALADWITEWRIPMLSFRPAIWRQEGLPMSEPDFREGLYTVRRGYNGLLLPYLDWQGERSYTAKNNAPAGH